MPIVGESLRGGIRAGTRAVEHTDLITQFALTAYGKQAVGFHTEIETGGHGGRDGIERVGQNDGSRERGGQHRQEGFAERGEIGVGEGRLELTGAETEAVVHFHVEPGLLQDVGTAGSGVDREVVGDFVVGFTGETEHGIRQAEAGIGHVVLVVGLVETFVVVPVERAVSLHHEIGFELEAAVVAAHGEGAVVVDAHHPVGGGFVLCVERKQRAGGESKSEDMFHFERELSCDDKM